ncbi:MAG: glycosyltransferase [Prochloraceae cyanobacterium]|nr:glycosyltransferase [Prochloraceae cyanobacterium]
MRLMVYSHDTYGLGNIRRMLAICEHLLKTIPDLSILLVSASPVIHSFRMPEGLDYIKLPYVGRNESGKLATRYINTDIDEAMKLRSDLIKATTINFKPDILLVDKKPYALQGELTETLNYLKTFCRHSTKVVLLLRDILDTPEKTIAEWHKNRYYEGIELFYDRVLVVGTPEIFDITKEYKFPSYISDKVKYCGYIRRELGCKEPNILRQELQVKNDEKLVLVTPGGGADGYNLVDNYLSAFSQLTGNNKVKTLIISGPEMAKEKRKLLHQKVANNPQIQIIEFTDDLNSYMEAADVVVCMGGYNTTCEILSLKKKAVMVPRFRPVQEQWIRAERMANMGLFKAIHPDRLTPENLMEAVLEQLEDSSDSVSNIEKFVDLDGLPRIVWHTCDLLNSGSKYRANNLSYLHDFDAVI